MLLPENYNNRSEPIRETSGWVPGEAQQELSQNVLGQLIERFGLANRRNDLLYLQNIDIKKWEALEVQARKYSAIGLALQKQDNNGSVEAISELSKALGIIKTNVTSLNNNDPRLQRAHTELESYLKSRENQLVTALGIISKFSEIETFVAEKFPNESLKVKVINEMLFVLFKRFDPKNLPSFIDKSLDFLKDQGDRLKDIADLGGLLDTIEGVRNAWEEALTPRLLEATLQTLTKIISVSSREEILQFEDCRNLRVALNPVKQIIDTSNVREYFGINQTADMSYQKLCEILSLTSRVLLFEQSADSTVVARARAKAEEFIESKWAKDITEAEIAGIKNLIPRFVKKVTVDSLDAVIKCERLVKSQSMSDALAKQVLEIAYSNIGSVALGNITPSELLEGVGELCTCVISRQESEKSLGPADFLKIVSDIILPTQADLNSKTLRMVMSIIEAWDLHTNSERGINPDNYKHLVKFITQFRIVDLSIVCENIKFVIDHAYSRSASANWYLEKLNTFHSHFSEKPRPGFVRNIIPILDRELPPKVLRVLGSHENYVVLINDILAKSFTRIDLNEISEVADCIVELASAGYTEPKILNFLKSLFSGVGIKNGVINVQSFLKSGIGTNLQFLKKEEYPQVLEYIRGLSSSGSEIKILKGQLRFGSTVLTPITKIVAASMASEKECVTGLNGFLASLDKFALHQSVSILKSADKYKLEINTVGEFFKQKPGTQCNKAVHQQILNYARRSSALDLTFNNTDLSPNDFNFNTPNGVVSGLQFFQTKFLQDMKIHSQTGASFKQGVDYPSLEELESLDEAISAELDKFEREVLPTQMTLRLRVTKGLLDLAVGHIGPDSHLNTTPDFFNERFQPVRIEGPNFEQLGIINLFKVPILGKEALLVAGVRLDKETTQKLDTTAFMHGIIEVARDIGERNNLAVYLHHFDDSPEGKTTVSSFGLSDGIRKACLNLDAVEVALPKDFRMLNLSDFSPRWLYKL
jgi:hypothetical protein